MFATGCLLAYASRFLFEFFGTSWLLQVGVNLIGVGTTFAVALLLEGHRARRATTKARAASGQEGFATGGRATLNINASGSRRSWHPTSKPSTGRSGR